MRTNANRQPNANRQHKNTWKLLSYKPGAWDRESCLHSPKSARALEVIARFTVRGYLHFFLIVTILSILKFCSVLCNHSFDDWSWWCHQRSRVQHLESLTSVPRQAGTCSLIYNRFSARGIHEMLTWNVKCKTKWADLVTNWFQSLTALSLPSVCKLSMSQRAREGL